MRRELLFATSLRGPSPALSAAVLCREARYIILGGYIGIALFAWSSSFACRLTVSPTWAVPDRIMGVFGRNVWSSALVKTVFGNWWQRFSRHSVTLQPFEVALLQAVVEAMPEYLRGPVEAHIDAATQVQWHLDPNGRTARTEWRGLHFYRLRGRIVDWSDVPPLPIADGTEKLLRLGVGARVDGPVLHVTANTHRRHFFEIQSGEDWRPLNDITNVIVEEMRQSWRSGMGRTA